MSTEREKWLTAAREIAPRFTAWKSHVEPLAEAIADAIEKAVKEDRKERVCDDISLMAEIGRLKAAIRAKDERIAELEKTERTHYGYMEDARQRMRGLERELEQLKEASPDCKAVLAELLLALVADRFDQKLNPGRLKKAFLAAREATGLDIMVWPYCAPKECERGQNEI